MTLGLPSTLLIALYVPAADPLQRTQLLDPLPLNLTVKGQPTCPRLWLLGPQTHLGIQVL